MTPALRRKLDALVERREEVERLLADPAVGADQNRFRTLSREFSTLQPASRPRASSSLPASRSSCARSRATRGSPG